MGRYIDRANRSRFNRHRQQMNALNEYFGKRRGRTLKSAVEGIEDDHAIAVADWLRAHGIKFIHVQNEQSTTKEGREKLRFRIMKQARMGVAGDFPDYLIFIPPPRMLGCHSAAFELKKPGEQLRAGQREWLRWLRDNHWAVPVDDKNEPIELVGVDHAIAQFEQWGYGRRRNR